MAYTIYFIYVFKIPSENEIKNVKDCNKPYSIKAIQSFLHRPASPSYPISSH